MCAGVGAWFVCVCVRGGVGGVRGVDRESQSEREYPRASLVNPQPQFVSISKARGKDVGSLADTLSDFSSKDAEDVSEKIKGMLSAVGGKVCCCVGVLLCCWQ